MYRSCSSNRTLHSDSKLVIMFLVWIRRKGRREQLYSQPSAAWALWQSGWHVKRTDTQSQQGTQRVKESEWHAPVVSHDSPLLARMTAFEETE